MFMICFPILISSVKFANVMAVLVTPVAEMMACGNRVSSIALTI